MTRGVIYMYTSPNGKSYIGQTIQEKFRRKLWNSSRYHYAGEKIDRARAKYGKDAFKYDILFEKLFASKEIASIWLNIVEQYFIQVYNTVDQGYNCEKGGMGNPYHTGAKTHQRGYKLSEEAKRHIGEGSRTWQNSPEGKAKMSALRKGKMKQKGYKNEANSLPVVQMTLTGEYIQEFPSIKAAEECIHKTSGSKNGSNISAVCRGKRDSALGYKWLIKDDYYNYFVHQDRKDIPQRVQRVIEDVVKRKFVKKPKIKDTVQKKPRINSTVKEVGQYDKNYSLVRVWRCVSDAALQLGICKSNISRAIRTSGMYKDCYWRHYEGQSTCIPKSKKKIEKPMLNKKVVQKDLQGNVLQVYDSIGKACSSIGAANRTYMSKCLNGKVRTAYGFKWEFYK